MNKLSEKLNNFFLLLQLNSQLIKIDKHYYSNIWNNQL